jgi:predicted dehydrogenase
MMAGRIRVGVVGAHAERGWARWTHLPALAELPGYEVTAVASTSSASAGAAAQVWGASYAFDDPYQLMAHPEVDLVTIAVQLPQRDGLVEGAIAAGKHVYSEWPLALDAATATRFRDHAVKAGVRNAVGLQSRHHPAIRYARDLIADGRLGELLSVTLTYSLSTPERWPERYTALFDETKGVNHLAIVCGHSIDMLRQVVGDFAELSATLATRLTRVPIIETGREVEATSPDQIVVSGLLESGAAASAHVVTGGPKGSGFRIEVHGRVGRLVLFSDGDSLVGPEFTVLLGQGQGGLEPVTLPERYLPLLPSAPPAVRNVHQVYTDLARAIRTGEPVEPNFDTAVSMHRVLDAIKLSAATGTRRRPDEPSR